MNLLQLFSPRKWASKWAGRCWKRTRPQRRDPQRPSFRPRLEVLEDRTLLTAYMVDLATDNNSGGGGQKDPNNANAGDLRYCLTQADMGAGNSITFAQAGGKTVYTIDLQTALPTVSQSMTISPAAGILATVERSATAKTDFRIFDIATGKTVSFGAFTIQNGLLKDGEGDGAGIYNDGTITLNNTVVQNNKTTTGNGGGLYNEGNLTLNGGAISGNSAVKGAGIYNFGTVTTAKGAKTLYMAGNVASQSGGGIYSDVGTSMILSRLNISNSTAKTGDGGGIYNAGAAKLDIQNATFKNDQAPAGSGGGIYNAGNPTINQCILRADENGWIAT